MNSQPTTPTRPATEDLLKAIFMTDIANGIYLAEDLDPRNITDATRLIDWFPGESLVVCFGSLDEGASPWPVVLTSRRVIYRPPDRPFPLNLYYPQIAHVARQLGTVIFTGHAGQAMLCYGLSIAQAAYLKRGLEKLVGELAFDPPGVDPE